MKAAVDSWERVDFLNNLKIRIRILNSNYLEIKYNVCYLKPV